MAASELYGGDGGVCGLNIRTVSDVCLSEYIHPRTIRIGTGDGLILSTYPSYHTGKL